MGASEIRKGLFSDSFPIQTAEQRRKSYPVGIIYPPICTKRMGACTLPGPGK
jgi:hypothetical protein